MYEYDRHLNSEINFLSDKVFMKRKQNSCDLGHVIKVIFHRFNLWYFMKLSDYSVKSTCVMLW